MGEQSRRSFESFQSTLLYIFREPLYSNSAVIAWWLQSTSAQNSVKRPVFILSSMRNKKIIFSYTLLPGGLFSEK